MKKQLIVALGILALVFSLRGPAGAANFADDDCANPDATINTAAEAVRVANGYNCPGVDLIINTSLDLTTNLDELLEIKAKTIKIVGPDVVTPAQRVEIIHNAGNPAKDIRITTTGDITISEAEIKAPDVLKITCTAPACKIDVKLSEIIASSSLLFGDPGGRLEIVAQGDLDIKTSTIYGGANLTIDSKTGSVVFICKPGEGGCKDPLVSSKDKELCGDPPVYPCTVTFADSKALKEVCIQSPGVRCGGGAIELHILAALDIDLTGSKIEGFGSFRIFSSKGRLLASGAELSADNFNIGIKGDGTAPSINFQDAKLTATGNIRIEAGSGCPAAPAVCVNAQGADMIASDIKITANNGKGVIVVCDASLDDLGGDKPVLNGDNSPPYDPNVADTAAECAPLPACSCL